jgi:uncharacterized protein YaeQ
MQMVSKVMRLELQYSCQQSHYYQRQTCYLAPFPDETAEHLAKRLLSYLILFELQPQWTRQPHSGKKPDLYLQDQQQHFLLWCQVDLPSEKQLHKAAHQSTQVVLVPEMAELQKVKLISKGLSNVSFLTLDAAQIDSCCRMFKGHMALSLWREDRQLLITDGKLMLELDLNDSLYVASHDRAAVMTLRSPVSELSTRH